MARKRVFGRTFAALTFTVGMFALVALAVSPGFDFTSLSLFVLVAGSAVLFYVIFPKSRFFTIAFANLLAVYICLFEFFVTLNFEPVSRAVQPIGFALPILAFLLAAEIRRRSIRRIVTDQHLREERHFGHVIRWLVPVFGIGAVTFAFPGMGLSQVQYDAAFLISLALIAVIVGFSSRDVTTFLLDTGLLFEEFFERMAHLMVPAFAFFTFYTLDIIVFAAIYRIIDRFGDVSHFRIAGEVQELNFPDALYFSAVTLSTVGYGEMTPASDLTKVIVSVQIVSGVLLLLFGFSEIISYTRERRERRSDTN
ncbi:MAG: ion channel [Alphaproteobacteria bacterium]|nr:ion channel [Alphaproteobacteria bacterium]